MEERSGMNKWGTRLENEMLVIPVSFGKHGAEMLHRASAIFGPERRGG
jgi:hypothetical protein